MCAIWYSGIPKANLMCEMWRGRLLRLFSQRWSFGKLLNREKHLSVHSNHVLVESNLSIDGA